jgi:hypothetical protein
MTKEGEFRNGMFLNGKYENVIVYGLLERERGKYKRPIGYVDNETGELKEGQPVYICSGFDIISSEAIKKAVEEFKKGAKLDSHTIKESCPIHPFLKGWI